MLIDYIVSLFTTLFTAVTCVIKKASLFQEDARFIILFLGYLNRICCRPFLRCVAGGPMSQSRAF